MNKKKIYRPAMQIVRQGLRALRGSNKGRNWKDLLPRNEASDFINRTPYVLQYRQAYFEIRGRVAPGTGLPKARAWPIRNNDISYRDKLVGLLPVDKVGAEIGPLNLPLLRKDTHKVLYVDHLDTKGINEKYHDLTGLTDVDRPMINNSLADTLRADAPLDYVVASQVFEHVPNPIRWLNEVAEILKDGALLALSMPDRRMTFDLYRQETTAAELYAAYAQDVTVPTVKMVYDNHLMIRAVNFHRSDVKSISAHEVVRARGSKTPERFSSPHLSYIEKAMAGEYLDIHCSVFTPVSFLLTYAQLGADGVIPYFCHQFYPTNESSSDRDNHSFTFVLKKASKETSSAEIRKSFLMALGE